MLSTDLLVDRLFSLLVTADRSGAGTVLHRELERGSSPEAVVQNAVLPVLRLLNELHRADQMTTTAYSASTRILAELTDELRALRDRAATSRFVAFDFTDGVLTARVTGPCLGTRETPIAGREIASMIDALAGRLTRLELDLSEITVASSMALGMCLDLEQRARAHRAQSVVVGASEPMRGVLRRIGRFTERETNRRPLARLLPRRLRPWSRRSIAV